RISSTPNSPRSPPSTDLSSPPRRSRQPQTRRSVRKSQMAVTGFPFPSETPTSDEEVTDDGHEPLVRVLQHVVPGPAEDLHPRPGQPPPPLGQHGGVEDRVAQPPPDQRGHLGEPVQPPADALQQRPGRITRPQRDVV